MKRLAFLGALLLVFSAAHSQRSYAAPQQPADLKTNAVAGEFVIKFKPGSPASEKAAIAQSIGGELSTGVPQLGVEMITVAALRNTSDVNAAADAISALQRNPAVEYVEPNYIYMLNNEPVRGAAIVGKIYVPMTVNITRFIPNDPALGSQYAWAKISAFDGWYLGRGNAGAVVAIVDTGIQLDHPDLQAKITPGYDFVDNDANASDGNGHGTHVAGTVAAMTNNSVGVAGTCPECRLMPVRVLNDSGSGTAVGVANGIIYAANNGAQVINLSLGGGYSAAIEDAVNYAWNRGSLLACAAGNSNTSDTSAAYPGVLDKCIGIASTTSSDERSWFSNYGTWVDIAAPGSSIYSTWPTHLPVNGYPVGYNSISGTSMATPHVAGVAGLLASQGMNNAQIRARLQSTADPISGTGTFWSNGRLNLFRALRGS